MPAEKINNKAVFNRTEPMAFPDNFAVSGTSSQGLPRSARSWSMLALVWLVSGAWYGYATTTVVGWGQNLYGCLDVPPDLTNVVAIATGNYHTLALRRDGTVVAWGTNSNGETNVPPGLSNVVAVAAGTWHSLALRADGTIVGWGRNHYGQTNIPTWLSNVVAVAAGSSHSVALRADGQVFAWGYNVAGQTNVPAALSNVVAIAARGQTSLGLKADGSVMAWGNNDPPLNNVPAAATNVLAIASSSIHDMALRGDGIVVAWGANAYGLTNVPANLSNVTAIAAGRSHSLALKANGELVAWGDNSNGQCDVPAGLSNIVALSGGTGFSVVMTSDGEHEPPQIFQVTSPGHSWSGYPVHMECWAGGGGPLFYQWHFENTLIPDATNAVLELANVQITNTGIYRVMVSNRWGFAAQRQTRLTVEEGPLYLLSQPTNVAGLFGQHLSLQPLLTGSRPDCQWFFNGQLFTNTTQAELVFPHLDFTHSGAYSFIMSNQFGAVTGAPIALTVYPMLALGTNTYGETNMPLVLANNSNVVAVAAGGGHNLVLLSDSTVLGWGNNSNGQATPPSGLSNVIAVAGGAGHSLALTVDGRVVAWGNNAYGQTNVPDGLSEVIAISAGSYHNLALRWDGTVVSWGLNSKGQCNVPPGLSNVVAVAAGVNHSLVLLANGTLAAWGNFYLDLPTRIPAGLSNVVAIAAGDYHNVAVKSDSTVVAWNINGSYYTDVPSGLSNVTQVAAGSFHSLALRADGTLAGWGWKGAGQGNVMAQFANVIDIAAGGQTSLALARVSTSAQPYQKFNLSADSYSGEDVHWSIPLLVYGPVAWQWQFNGQDLPGATNNSLSLVNVQTSQSGVYSVLVRNDTGWQFQAQFQLTVTDSPIMVISQPPTQTDVLYGMSTTLTCRVEGSLPIAYQWLYNEMPMPRATNESLTFPAVHPVQAGEYVLTLSNRFGVTTSAPVQMRISVLLGFGRNDYGQSAAPDNLTNVVDIAAGWEHSLALLADGTVAAWGNNSRGQLNVPSGLTNVVAITAGYWHSLALQADGTVTQWGDAAQMPDGLSNVVSVAADAYFSMALKDDGELRVWGEWASFTMTNVVTMAGGAFMTAALSADGRAEVANLGFVPSSPQGFSDAIAIAAGVNHCLALSRTGTVATYGAGLYGQEIVPTGLSNVVAIAAGNYFSLALTAEGQAVGWGSNEYGQLAIPTGLKNVRKIAAGGDHTLLLLGDAPQWRGRIAKTGNGPTTNVRLTVPVWGRATVESTTNLHTWTPWLEITNTFGPVELPLPLDQSRRFLRWSK